LSDGEADKVKSARKIARERVAICSSLVPLTVRLRGLAVDAESPEMVTVLLSPALIDVGTKEQVAPVAQESEMLLVKLLGATAEMVKVVDVVPMRIVFEGPSTASEKTGTPVPMRTTPCGLPVALSVTARPPLRVPLPVGVKDTLIVQIAPTPMAEGQLFVWAKSPLVEMLSIVRSVSPVFVSVTVLGELVVPTV
jgi:hypothetical protein